MSRLPAYVISFVLLAGLIVAAIGCGGSITGSANIKTEEMQFSNFTKVEVGSAFEVDISQGDSYVVSITANDNLFQHLDIRQSGQTLHIGLKQPRIYFRTVQKAAIVMPELERLSLSGASKGEVHGFNTGKNLELELSGASSLFIDSIKAGDTEFDLSGASKATGSITMANGTFHLSGASTAELKGSAKDITVEASGASHARLVDLPATNVRLNLSGASEATINASGTLDGELSGASRLRYAGNPTLGRINTSGASTINRIQ